MIDLECSLTNDDLPKINNRAIVLTDRIIFTVVGVYDSEENTLELIFYHDANTRGRTIDPSVLRWGQWQTVRDHQYWSGNDILRESRSWGRAKNSKHRH